MPRSLSISRCICGNTPDVHVIYDGHEINPGELVKSESEFTFDYTTEDGMIQPQTLTILEWHVPMNRALFLCSRKGFSFRELPAGIHAPGLQFTAYLRSEYIEELEDKDALEIELGDLGKLLEQARDRLRKYNLQLAGEASFRDRHGVETGRDLSIRRHYRQPGRASAASSIRCCRRERVQVPPRF